MLEVEKVTHEEQELDTLTKKALRGVDENNGGDNSYVGNCNPVCGPRFCCPETGWYGGLK